MDRGDNSQRGRSFHGWIDTDEVESPLQRSQHNPLKRALLERSPASLQHPGAFRSPRRMKAPRSSTSGHSSNRTNPDKSVYAIQKEALCRELKTSNHIRKQLEEQLIAVKAELRAKTEVLRRSSPHIEEEYNLLLEQHSALASEADSIKEELASRENDIEKLSIKLNEAQHELNIALQELNDLHGKHSDLESMYGAQNAAMDTLRAELNSQKENSATSDDQLCHLREQVQLLNESRDELLTEKESMNAKIADLSSYIEQVEVERANLESKLTFQLTQSKLEISNAQQKLQTEHESFKAIIAETEQRAHEQLMLKDEDYRNVTQSLLDAESKLEKLQEAIAISNRDKDMLKVTSNEHRTLQSRRIGDLEAEISELRENYNAMKLQSAKNQTRAASLAKKLDQANCKAISLQEVEKKLREALDRTRDENQLFDSQRTELAMGLEREKTWREHTVLQLQRAEALNSEFRAELEKNANHFKETISGLRVEIGSLEQALDKCKLEVSTSKLELEHVKEQHHKESHSAMAMLRQDEREKLTALDEELLKQQALLTQERKTTRRLQNQIQELKGNIRIVARIRPMKSTLDSPPAANMKLKSDEILLNEVETSVNGIARNKLMKVQFDRVFGPDASNHEICEETEYLIQSALDGRNVCIFAYGQTGSGKTYTMSGRNGVNAYALRKLMEAVDDSPSSSQRQLFVESVEIYNEQLFDLLDDTVPQHSSLSQQKLSQNTNSTSKLSIQINPQTGQPELAGAKRIKIDNNESAQAVLIQAMRHRSTAATNANSRSSRSHFVFSVRIITPNTQGTLHLVDLAGSERLTHSQTAGDRLKETQAINTSLSSLGNVINALLNKKSTTHIPYRSSKLTYLLQGSLSGNAKTMLLTTLSPEQMSIEETKSTLRFAEKASRATLR